MERKCFENNCFRLLSSIKKRRIDIAIIYSRFRAHRLRREVIKKKDTKVVNRKVKRTIKEYAKERFGKRAYWPFLALYTEIKGEFIKGWIPYDYFRYILLPEMNPQSYRVISDHKTLDYKIFGDFAIKPIFLYISNMFYSADFDILDEMAILSILSEYDENIVVKEEVGTQGKQVRFMHSSDFTPDMLTKNVNYIIQPYIKQYKTINDIYPHSVNTMRVVTYLRQNGSIDVKMVYLRFGVDGAKVDNIHAGGQCIYLDKKGKPSKSSYDEKGVSLGERHKNSGYLFSDLEIPMFNDVLGKCKNAHLKYPYVRLIGWDVSVMDTGEIKLIEWNADNPGFWNHECVNGPLWPKDEDLYN